MKIAIYIGFGWLTFLAVLGAVRWRNNRTPAGDRDNPALTRCGIADLTGHLAQTLDLTGKYPDGPAYATFTPDQAAAAVDRDQYPAMLKAVIGELWRNLQLVAERDGAYRERAALLAWLAALHSEGQAVLTQAPPDDTGNDGWPILFIYGRGRQLSWHINPRDLDLYGDVPWAERDDPRAQWDHHTTEEKYQRIQQLVDELWSECGPECSEAHTYTGRCCGARPPAGNPGAAQPDLVQPDADRQASAPQEVEETEFQRVWLNRRVQTQMSGPQQVDAAATHLAAAEDSEQRRQRYADAIRARLARTTAPNPAPWSGEIGNYFGATEYDLADAALAVRDRELEDLYQRLAALDSPEQPAPNPTGSTQEQLPEDIRRLIESCTIPYVSTACQTGKACRGAYLHNKHLIGLLQHADTLHTRCRLSQKFTGQPCRCDCHSGEQSAAPSTLPVDQLADGHIEPEDDSDDPDGRPCSEMPNCDGQCCAREADRA